MFSRKDIPIVYVILAWLAGIMLHTSMQLKLIPLLLILTCSFLIVVSFSFKYKLTDINSWLLWICIIGLSYFYTDFRAPENNTELNSGLNIASVGYLLEYKKSASGAQRLIFDIKTGRFSSEKILVWCKDCDDESRYRSGSAWQLNVYLQEVPTEANPNVFCFKTWLRHQGVLFQAYASKDQLHRYPQFDKNTIRQKIDQFRLHCLQVLKNRISSESARAILAALSLGHKDWIETAIRETYSKTGAMHVLAVSGLHTGIIAGILLFCLSPLPERRYWQRVFKATIAIIALWLFAMLSGMAPSVMRASTMFSLILIAKFLLKRKVNIYNTIAASALVLLIHWPPVLYQISFQLSYAALLGIVGFQDFLFRSVYFPFALARKIWALITLSISAQLGTLAFTIYYFNMFPIYAWLSGILVVPLASLLLSLSIALYAFSGLAEIGSGIARILTWLTDFQNHSIHVISQLPFNSLEQLWLPFPSLVFITAAWIALGFFIHHRKSISLITSLIFFSIALIIHTSFLFHWSRQHLIINYASKNHILVDYYDGIQCICISSLPPNHALIHKLTFKNRLSHGIRSCEYKGISDVWITSNIVFTKGIFHLKNESLQLKFTKNSPYTRINIHELINGHRINSFEIQPKKFSYHE